MKKYWLIAILVAIMSFCFISCADNGGNDSGESNGGDSSQQQPISSEGESDFNESSTPETPNDSVISGETLPY